MLDNPWLRKKSGKSPKALIEQDCKRKGVSIDDPTIRRECYGEWLEDSNSLVVRYNAKLNHYEDLPVLTNFVLGVDIGHDDADAIACIGWSDGSPNAYLVEESIGKALLSINSTWDPVNTRVAADRTPDPVNGTILGCTLEGCEVGIKNQYPNNPAWGAEYWGTGSARGLAWNYELAFVAPFLDNWQKGRTANAFGMAQWYFADTPGETGQFVEAGNSTTAPGNSNAVRSLGASAVDQNRFPKLLYYVYEAAWTPFSIKPVVELAGHWNLSGSVQVNAFSNCPSVKLLLNGVQQGGIKTPNPWNSNDESNQTETTTLIPFQTSWIVPWASGTIQAQCLDSSGTVVATDSRTTAGAENKIVLSVVPELTKPSGTPFSITANGSDAAFVTATIEDANGNWEPLAADNVTFSVTGPATYQGGTQQYVSTTTDAFSTSNSTVISGVRPCSSWVSIRSRSARNSGAH